MDERERKSFHVDFERALGFVTKLHAEQTRKQTDIPYISHLIGVAGLVLEHGGGRDEAIGALLHDSIEDCGAEYPDGVEALRQEIEARFGADVRYIVDGCTDTDTTPKPPWRERKMRYLIQLETAPEQVRLVSCADKLHKARCIVADLRIMGDSLFNRFTGGREGTLWYYESLAEIFEMRGPVHLAKELRRTVDTMKALAGQAN